MKCLTATFALVLLTGAAVPADETLPRRSSQLFDAVKAGALVVEPPTLICLGFEWEISGDQNRNATVAVTYRRCADRPGGPGRLEAGVAAAADGRRADFPRSLHGSRSIRREHPGPRSGYRVRGAPDHVRSGRRERAGRADGQGPHARGAESGHRRARAARLPARAGAERKRSRITRGSWRPTPGRAPATGTWSTSGRWMPGTSSSCTRGCTKAIARTTWTR